MAFVTDRCSVFVAGKVKSRPRTLSCEPVWYIVSWNHCIQSCEDRYARLGGGTGYYQLWYQCSWLHAALIDTRCSPRHQMHHSYSYTLSTCCKWCFIFLNCIFLMMPHLTNSLLWSTFTVGYLVKCLVDLNSIFGALAVREVPKCYRTFLLFMLNFTREIIK